MAAPRPFPNRDHSGSHRSGFGAQPVPITLQNKETGEIHSFPSGKDAAKGTGLTPASISQLRNKQRWQARCIETNITWRLPGVQSPSGHHGRRAIDGGRKPISLRCMETNQVFHYGSHKDACNDLMLDPTALSRLTSGTQRTYKGLRLA